MKIKITLLVIIFAAGICNAQTDSLYLVQQQKIESLEREARTLKNDVSYLTRQMNTLQSQMNNLSREIGQKIEGQQTALDGISSEVNANAESIANTSAILGERIDQADDKTDVVANNLRGKTIGGIIIALGLLILSVLAYLLLRKRISKGDSAIEEIEQTQKRLQEESVKLDSKLVELLEGQMKVAENKPTNASSTPDHALALKVADEITRIETNLSRMDASIRGYKQLMASVKRIKDNFMANGYELVEMLGKPYNEGMRVNADFVIDEELEEGKRIITTVTKPQVNYNGEMIQKATITVSQNI